MVDSVMVHSVLKLEAALGAVDDAGAWTTPPHALALALYDVLNPVLGALLSQTLPTPREQQSVGTSYCTEIKHQTLS